MRAARACGPCPADSCVAADPPHRRPRYDHPAVLLKLVAFAFVAGVLGRVLFPSRWKDLGVWFRRFIDLVLLALFVAFTLQLLMLWAA